jgi:acetoin utilization protein AcuB
MAVSPAKERGDVMIVRDIMTTKLTTVEPDDTLAHATSLLRQYQFHHLPVARAISVANEQQNAHGKRQTALLFEGLLTSQDIDLVALSDQDPIHPWQERRVVEVMHRAIVRVTPTTPVASAAQILVERGLNYLPVIEFGQAEHSSQIFLVGLVTRSDLLMALARAMGAFEPGM